MEELTPLTREEEILNTLLSAAGGGSVEDLTPETRKEQWYQNALDAINGNELTYDLAAEWRREQWYTKLIEALQEGCGGGSVPEYEGSYSVTPSESAQTLATKDKKCTDDITVNPISPTYIGSGVTQKAAATYTPTTSDQTIAANQYLSGAQTVKGDANLVSGNIKKDTQIFGVTGTYEGSGGGGGGATTVTISGDITPITYCYYIDEDGVYMRTNNLTDEQRTFTVQKGTLITCLSSYAVVSDPTGFINCSLKNSVDLGSRATYKSLYIILAH